MNHLTADQALIERLAGIVEPVEIRDPEGKVMGTYTPVLSPEEQEWYRQAAAMFDPEELDRIEKEGGPTCTTAEVLAYLESLEKKE